MPRRHATLSWNGVKNHGNHYLLTQVLKERMGFDGLVVGGLEWSRTSARL